MFVGKKPVLPNNNMLIIYLQLHAIKYVIRSEFDITACLVYRVVQKSLDTRDSILNVECQLRFAPPRVLVVTSDIQYVIQRHVVPHREQSVSSRNIKPFNAI